MQRVALTVPSRASMDAVDTVLFLLENNLREENSLGLLGLGGGCDCGKILLVFALGGENKTGGSFFSSYDFSLSFVLCFE